MPRKSQALRLQQAIDLHTAYTEAGVTGTAYSFVGDMVTRMKRKKYPTTRQRNWLDKLIDEGVPQAKGDVGLLGKIDTAVKYWHASGTRDWERGVLLDMRRVVFNDWKMSEKQTNLLSKLLQRYDDDLTGANVFTPSDSQHRDLAALVKLYYGYSRMWAETRPAVRKAVDTVERFLQGEGVIEEYHYNKLMKAMGSKLNKFNSPRWKTGDAGFYTARNAGGVRGKVMLLCASDVYINDRGGISNDWVMPTGEICSLHQDRVSKR